jgi:hypothetical protein
MVKCPNENINPTETARLPCCINLRHYINWTIIMVLFALSLLETAARRRVSALTADRWSETMCAARLRTSRA